MLDLRLVGPAIGVWLGAIAALALDSRWPLALAAVCLALAALWWVRSLVLAVSLCGALAGVIAAGLAVVAAHPAELAEKIAMRETVAVTGVVATDAAAPPARMPAVWASSAAMTEFILNVERVDDVAISAPMLLRCECEVSVGARIRAIGRISPDVKVAEHIAAVRVEGPIEVIEEPGPVNTVANALRAGLREALAQTPPDAAALIAGLSVGDESMQSPQLADDMRASGLSHLTAVSGGNVAIVIVVVLAIVSVLGLGRRSRYVVIGLAVVGFVILVRPQPSVLRAAVMGIVVVAGLFAGRPSRGISTLSVAVIVLVLISPGLAMSFGFALSTVATAGLLVLAPLLVRRMRAHPIWGRAPQPLLLAVAATIAAQLATTPIIALMGSGIGSSSVIANLLAAPLVAPVTIGGLLAAALSLLAMPVAQFIAMLVTLPALGIAAIAHHGATWPMLPLPAGWFGALAATGITAVVWFAPKHWIRLALALALAAMLMAPLRRAGWPPPEWVLIACDVGQGDALLARTGPDSAIVIDAGPDPTSVDRCLDDAGVSAVPLLVLTHFHADHIDGLDGVLEGREVGDVLVSPDRVPKSGALVVDAALADRGIGAHVAAPGEQFTCADTSWRVLWPRASDEPNPNNASVVLLADLGGVRVLFTGDIEPDAQSAMMSGEAPLGVDVIKVPHHGSRYQDPSLIQWSGARVALVSVGAQNTYGHPAAETLQAWTDAGALVARTDTDGDVAISRQDGQLGVVVKG